MALPLHIDPIDFPAHTKRSRPRPGTPERREGARRLSPVPVAPALERRPVDFRIVAGGAADPRSRVAPHRPTRWQYRRRRVMALFVLGVVACVAVAAISTAGRLVSVLTRTTPVAAASAAPSIATGAMLHGERLVPGGTYVARAGDTMWVIARALQPQGDLSRIMRRFATLNDGLSLHVGQRVYLPS